MAVSVLGLAGRAGDFRSRLRPFRPDSARGERAQRELGLDRAPLLPARALSPFSVRSAACNGALQNRGPGAAWVRAAWRHSVSKTRVNALMAPHRVRDARP